MCVFPYIPMIGRFFLIPINFKLWRKIKHTFKSQRWLNMYKERGSPSFVNVYAYYYRRGGGDYSFSPALKKKMNLLNSFPASTGNKIKNIVKYPLECCFYFWVCKRKRVVPPWLRTSKKQRLSINLVLRLVETCERRRVN